MILSKKSLSGVGLIKMMVEIVEGNPYIIKSNFIPYSYQEAGCIEDIIDHEELVSDLYLNDGVWDISGEMCLELTESFDGEYSEFNNDMWLENYTVTESKAELPPMNFSFNESAALVLESNLGGDYIKLSHPTSEKHLGFVQVDVAHNTLTPGHDFLMPISELTQAVYNWYFTMSQEQD